MERSTPEIPPRPGEVKKKSRSLPAYGRSGPPLDHIGIFKSFEQEDALNNRSTKQHRRKKKHRPPSSDGSNSSSSLSDTSCSSVEFLTPQKWFSQGSRLGYPSSKRPSGSVHGSVESLSRRDRLEAVKARVAAERRAKCRDSSSEEEEMQQEICRRLPRYHSDEVLGRSRSARTERYLKRRSQDELSLRQQQNASPVEADDLTTGRHLMFSWRDSDAYEPFKDNTKSILFNQANHSSESAKENRPDTARKKNTRSNSLCVLPAPSPVHIGPKTHPFRGQHQCKPLSVSTSYGINFGHPSPCDSGLSSQSVASSPSIGRAPTPPPRSPQSKVMVNEAARHLKPPSPAGPQRPVSCSLETVFDSGRYSKSPTLTLQSETSSGRSSPWVQRMVANYEKRQLDSSTPGSKIGGRKPLPLPQHHQQQQSKKPEPSHVYSYTDLPPTLIENSSSGAIIYSYTDEAPSTRKSYDPPHPSAYMSDSQLLSRKSTPLRWRSNRLSESPVVTNSDSSSSLMDSSKWRRSQTPPPPTSSRSAFVRSVQQSHRSGQDSPISSPNRQNIASAANHVPPDPPVRRESNSYVSQRHRRCSENLEDALQELEEIYNSLRLNSDEDLLDRAERRDLPYAHQILRKSSNNHASEPEPDVNKMVNGGYTLTRSCSDGVPFLTSTSFDQCHRPHQRTPPYRRSAIPDKVGDDMANRKVQKLPKQSSEDANPISYMLCSPVFTPTLNVDEFFKDFHNRNQPDVEYDDLNYRKHSQSVAARVLAPHPPFGIPLGPVSHPTTSDYLTKVTTAPKPSYRSKGGLADPVRDDMAYRNLRKDPPTFVVENGHDPPPTTKTKRTINKHRAVRSLSANFTALLNPSPPGDSQEFERAQSMSDLIAALEKESEKWERLSHDGSANDLRPIPPSAVKPHHTDMGSSTETLTESRSSLSKDPKQTSFRSPTPPVPTRRSLALPSRSTSHHHDFWSDSDIKQHSGQVTPIDDKELDDLLSSLTRDASTLAVPTPESPGSSGEVHGVYRLRPNSPPSVY